MRIPLEFGAAQRRTASMMADAPAMKLLADLYGASTNTHAAVMQTFSTVERWLQESRFAYCDVTLRLADESRLSQEVMVALLTITNPARQMLGSYGRFAGRVRGRLSGTHPPGQVAEILRGLE
jgi:hypothetical protein